MKLSSMRLGAALLLMLSLAACGGKKTYNVSGTLVNTAGVETSVNNTGLVLANGSDTVTVPAGASRFTFPNQIDYGDEYNITVVNSPVHMTCLPSTYSSGSAGHYVSIEALIQCYQNTFAVSGTVTGLTATGTGLVIANGAATYLLTTAADPTFSFEGIPVGTTYGITINTQPVGQTCSVSTTGTSGTGTMGDAAVSGVVINCTTP